MQLVVAADVFYTDISGGAIVGILLCGMYERRKDSGSIALISEGRMEAGSVITVCLLFQQLIKPIDEVDRFMDERAFLRHPRLFIFDEINKLREENAYETDRNECKSRKNEERRISYEQRAQKSAEAYAAS